MTSLDKHSEGCEILLDINFQLQSLAKSFLRVGNFFVNEELCEITYRLEKAHELIRHAMSNEINSAFEQSQRNSFTVLQAVMAGSKLAKPNTPT